MYKIRILLLALTACLITESAHAQWIVKGKGDDRTVQQASPEEVMAFFQEYRDQTKMSVERFQEYLKYQKKFTPDLTYIPDQLLRILTKENPDSEVDAYIHVVWDSWANRICDLDSNDVGTCNNLASACGYKACSPSAAITGLFGGCAGLLCSCSLDDGSTFGDAIGMSEINAPQCDKFIPFGNRRRTEGQGDGYDPNPYDWPPRP